MVTRAVLARIAMRRADGAGQRTATPRWKRIAASTVLLLLVAALVATILLASGLGPQPASAAPPCENGTVVPNHADHPGLVADCAVLLAAKDTLRGAATLNWSATTPITDWTGITVSRAPKRVTKLNLDSMSLNGSIPAELGELSALRELRLAWNPLTGTIPPELGQLTQLGQLVLGGNRLTGAIPSELGSIGATLTTLQLSGPNPLPTGIGLSGSIPPQLGNLTGLQQLWLNGNRLTGTIPTRLGRLTQLRGLHLDKNQLSGSIPTQLGALSNLTDLQLQDNQLTGPLPSQLGGLTQLNKIYLLRNAGFSGCVPLPLRRVRYHHFDWLGLPDCAADAPDTPVTPLPTFTLTATAGEGGSVDPAGATTHDEAAEVTLTASWNDATHTFAGWGADCSGTATTCVLEMYADKTVTATFTALAADRCATPTAADCIRAVYLGAPDDYAHVQDIPAELLLAPDDDGRYRVRRDEQVTVVTAAPLPSGYTQFYLHREPTERILPTSYEQLIPPAGTTYTFTVTDDKQGATLITFDLTAARPLPISRPGIKPELGAVVVTTVFRVASCASGTAVADPTNDAGLVGDCERLIGLRDVLAGSAALNWDVRTAITGWQGVTISGTAQRVTGLNLASLGLNGELSGLLGELDALTTIRLNANALTGRIPSKLTTLTNLTHLYLAGNSFAGCLPPDLRDVANHDLSSLSLTDCGAPDDISYGEHTLTAGTYEFALVDDGPAVMFDVPAGLTLEIVGIVLSESEDGDSTLGLILRNTSEQSWICVDLEAAEECYRKIVSTAQPGTTDIAALFDRLAESLWMDDGS